MAVRVGAGATPPAASTMARRPVKGGHVLPFARDRPRHMWAGPSLGPTRIEVPST